MNIININKKLNGKIRKLVHLIERGKISKNRNKNKNKTQHLRMSSRFNSGTLSHPLPTYSTQLHMPSYSTHIFKSFPLSDESHKIKTVVPSFSTRSSGFSQVSLNPSVKTISSQAVSALPLSTPAVLVPIAPMSTYQYDPYYRRQSIVASDQSSVQNSPQSISQSLKKTFEVQDNQDPNPILIKKKPTQPIKYTQNVSFKFLKPPALEPAGDIVITQLKDVQSPPVAPKIIRQKPTNPIKPGKTKIKYKSYRFIARITRNISDYS